MLKLKKICFLFKWALYSSGFFGKSHRHSSEDGNFLHMSRSSVVMKAMNCRWRHMEGISGKIDLKLGSSNQLRNVSISNKPVYIPFFCPDGSATI